MRWVMFVVRVVSGQTGTVLTRTRTAGKPTARGIAVRLGA